MTMKVRGWAAMVPMMKCRFWPGIFSLYMRVR